MAVVGVDLGGTNITVALVDASGRVLDRKRPKTPRKGPEAVVRSIAKAIGKLDESPDAVGVGVPGPVRDGVVETAPNLRGWDGPVPVRDLLLELLDVPVVVDNDANVGVLGEWVAGAGRGAKFLLGVWLGTGVGGGLVLDGRPYTGAFGGAGELGHVVVQHGGERCGCGRRGCLEAYAGRAAMEARVEAQVAAGRRTLLHELRARYEKKRVTSGIWAEALAEGDPVATEVFDAAVDALGAAIGGAVNLLDLDAVVVGGGVAEKMGAPLADRLAAAVRPWLLVPDAPRRFAIAALGDDAGVIGAAMHARAHLLEPVDVDH